MLSIAIITARGGSKRIPRKNIRPFLGAPVISYSIRAALESGCFSTVMVSTDDGEIADVARRFGADIPFMRSEKTSDDFATTADVLTEVLQEYDARGERFEAACCLYPTAPFVTAEKIRTAMRMLEDSCADTVMPVVRFSYPVQRALLERDGFLAPEYPAHLNSRSQDLAPRFHDAGQFYCFRTGAFLKNRHLMLGKILPYELPETEVQDIDTETDWHIAEMKYRLMTNQTQGKPGNET